MNNLVQSEPADSKKHAILSPSAADRWMTCPGSVNLSKDLPDIDNQYSLEGTDYHEVAAVCLEEGTNAIDYVDRPMLSGEVVTEDNAIALQIYIDAVRAYAATGTLLIEEAVPIGHLTGEEGAQGTLDAAVLREDRELIVADLKFGRGVSVKVENNRQLKIYALGLLEKHELTTEYDTVRLVVCQPRAGGTQEWVISVKDLLDFKFEVGAAATRVATEPTVLVPSESACRWCRAKAICPALRAFVNTATADDFEDLTQPRAGGDQLMVSEILGLAMNKVALVEIWMKAVRAAVEIELLAGRSVSGWKLVQGKKGNRKWEVESDAETMMKSFRMTIEEMYDLSLISPTTAEKKLKKEHPRRWKSLEPLITQKPGVPSVAPESDPRPALVMSKPEEGFAALPPEDGQDLI